VGQATRTYTKKSATVLSLIIKVYQYLISPFFGNCCRFHPSCSHYALEAIQSHGYFKGCFLTLRRLSRCHPWHTGGYDPVPEKITHAN
jgi:hypothetical protein